MEAGLFFVEKVRYRIFEPVTLEAICAWLKKHEESSIDELISQTIETIKHRNSARGIWFETLLGHLIAGIHFDMIESSSFLLLIDTQLHLREDKAKVF